jgi:TRAP-type C4-dicarboxylate transport system substrate-binding protein
MLAVTFSANARAATTLKMATLAPERSPWGKVFRAWGRTVSHKTGGSVDVVWLWNGSAGPETTALGKVKTGQLAGAAVSGTALGALHQSILALQIPGMFQSWSELDRVRAGIEIELGRAIEAQGLVIGAWGDVGVGRILSQGFEVRRPADLRGKRPGYLRDTLIAPKLFDAIGGITPRPGSVGEVLGLLTSGSINVLVSTSLAAEQLQWASRLSHMNALPVGYGIGAIVLGDRQIQALSADERETVRSTARLAGDALSKRIRQQDDEAFRRLGRRLSVHEPTAAERAEWKQVFSKACQEIEKALPANAVQRAGGCH